MRKFKIEPYWWDDEFKIYTKESVEIKDGVTILISCNGGGKSTLIHQIKHRLKDFDDEVYIMEYSDMESGRSNAMDKFGFYGDFDKFGRNFISSEGENVSNNFGDFLGTIAKKVDKAAKCGKKEFWIFLDGIDSGVSVDIVRQQSDVMELIESDIRKTGMIPYIIIATNQYESIGKYKNNCLDVINLKYITLESYDEYVNHIMYTSELKEQRYHEGNKRIKSRRKRDKWDDGDEK